ncbi:MAG: SH3 domain-containing protein [Cyanobacteria bacterium P01_D01_bin.128]
MKTQYYGWMIGLLTTVILGGCGSAPDIEAPADDAAASAPVESSAETQEAEPQAGESGTPPPTPDPALTDFPHKRIEVIDQVEDGSEFDQFRDRLRQAVEDRDRDFIVSLVPEGGVNYGFGGPMQPEDMDLGSSNSWFWQVLDKMTAPASCETDDYPPVETGNTVWVCPNISAAYYRQYPPSGEENEAGLSEEFATVIVIGRNVNVRSAPSTSAQVVAQLTNELVTVDSDAQQRLFEENPDLVPGAIDGWTPVVLPNQVQGYVYNRYAYQPLSPRAIFENVDGQWTIIRVLAGD